MANYYISAGQVSSGIVLSNWDKMYVYSMGTLNRSIVSGNGSVFVSSGGMANSTTVNSGYLYVSNGGVENSTTVNSG